MYNKLLEYNYPKIYYFWNDFTIELFSYKGGIVIFEIFFSNFSYG